MPGSPSFQTRRPCSRRRVFGAGPGDGGVESGGAGNRNARRIRRPPQDSPSAAIRMKRQVYQERLGTCVAFPLGCSNYELSSVALELRLHPTRAPSLRRDRG
jgi:hypothetical protein